MNISLFDITRNLGLEYKEYYDDLTNTLDNNDKVICVSSRQSGKTLFSFLEAQRYAINNKNSLVLFIFPYMHRINIDLLFKTVIDPNCVSYIKRYYSGFTIQLWNGSKIRIMEKLDYYSRFLYSCDYMIFDEINYNPINNELNQNFYRLTCQKLFMISTPNSRIDSENNFMYKATKDNIFEIFYLNPEKFKSLTFKQYHISNNDVSYRNEILGKF